jgi:bifunctional non-homologous end joining protein LigD
MKDSVLFPETILPQLSTPSQNPPEGDQWLHEIKLDGFRLLCRKDGEIVDFYTRAGHNWGGRLPAIADEVRQLDSRQAWLDGELVVMINPPKSVAI